MSIFNLNDKTAPIKKGIKPHRKKIVITFDDGYKDNYDFVFPYLSEKKIPFTLFVCNGLINNSIYTCLVC